MRRPTTMWAVERPEVGAPPACGGELANGQTTIYCGVPDANSAFRIAQGVFDEIDRA